MIRREGSKTVITTAGRIDALSASAFAAEMEEAVKGTDSLVIDCGVLDYISSSGLRVVMLAVKAMKNHGELKVINVCEPVYEILEATGFTGICDIERKA